MSPGLVSGGGGKGEGGGRGVIEIACTFLEELLLGGSDAKKWGDHQKKKFFINNSLISIKVLGLCDIISVMYVFAPPMGLNYSLSGD